MLYRVRILVFLINSKYYENSKLFMVFFIYFFLFREFKTLHPVSTKYQFKSYDINNITI